MPLCRAATFIIPAGEALARRFWEEPVNYCRISLLSLLCARPVFSSATITSSTPVVTDSVPFDSPPIRINLTIIHTKWSGSGLQNPSSIGVSRDLTTWTCLGRRRHLHLCWVLSFASMRDSSEVCLIQCSQWTIEVEAWTNWYMLVILDFLQVSRSTIDDSITQNLNALMTPALKGFDPSSTAVRQTESRVGRPIDPEACQGFKHNVLFPSWQTRSDVLNYCAGVATSPDPDDPDLILRQTESARDRERVVDERLDPYSARFFPQEARTESLANLVRNQRMVEDIIRARTWASVIERCSGSSSGWNQELNSWRERQQQPPSQPQ